MFDNELVDQQIAISGTGEPHRRTLEREVEDIMENRPSGLFRETSEMVHAQDCGILQPPEENRSHSFVAEIKNPAGSTLISSDGGRGTRVIP